MTAEVIEKGDATFTIKYTARNGQEAMMISMMSDKVDHVAYMMANHNVITVPSIQIKVLDTLSRTFNEEPQE